jgi:hypothetical protein
MMALVGIKGIHASSGFLTLRMFLLSRVDTAQRSGA